jgi:biopolymer transport protein ExbD/biopolymer transport protein TolR
VPVSHFKLHRIRQKIRTAKKRPKVNIVADINVTPLVDVVLVLLIIFMVVTPMIARGVPVDLPQTMHHSKKPDDGKDIIVSVTKDKLVYITSNKVQIKDVPRIIEEERRRFPEKTVYVKGDARTTYGAVREVMEAIHKANIDDVMLGTDDVKEKH